jgi:ribosomal protein L11 methyltransferase
MPTLRRRFLLPAHREDLFLAELWRAGTLGVETVAPADTGTPADNRLVLEAWFAAGSPPLPPDPEVELLDEEEVAERDWLAPYREQARPFPVGRSFLLDPREPGEPSVPVPSGRHLLSLPARAAFGTGSHESTALALELLETAEVHGRRVLDVGTGTGVLGFAALVLGAASVVAFDVDPAAPFHARDNARWNRLTLRLFVGRLAALSPANRFDLALVNVVPEQIFPEAPTLLALLAPGAEAVFSGILIEQGADVLARLAGFGLAERDRRAAGGWIAFRLGRR